MICLMVIIVVIIVSVCGTVDNFVDRAFKEKDKWNGAVIENHEQRIRELESLLKTEERKK